MRKPNFQEPTFTYKLRLGPADPENTSSRAITIINALGKNVIMLENGSLAPAPGSIPIDEIIGNGEHSVMSGVDRYEDDLISVRNLLERPWW